MRVLVIDDEKSMLRTLQRMLGPEHEVAVAESASGALLLLANPVPFDVILCDLHMPEMTGETLAEKVTADDAARIIFTTGGACNQHDATFLASRHVLMKPFSSAELRDALDSLRR